LKPPQSFTLIGKPLPAKNLQAIVRATAVYGLDVRVPDMLYAVIERSPVINGRVARVDETATRAVEGVTHVVKLRGNTFPTLAYVRDGVAVVARSTWAAMQGRAQLKVDWNESWADTKARNGALASSSTLAQDFNRALAGEAVPTGPDVIHPAVTAVRQGTADSMADAFKRATKTLDLVYDVPLQAHVPMEPMNAVAHWTPTRCEVWAPCHAQTQLHNVLRELTGLPGESVIIHTPLLGGSFGRCLDADYAIEAMMLSREINRPVQVVWTRQDDIRFGLYAPPSRHTCACGLGCAWPHSGTGPCFRCAVGTQTARTQLIAADGLDATAAIDAVKFPYATDNLHVSHRLVEQAIRVFWWRRGYTPNHTFVNECLLDECAHAVGIDALQYRLGLLAPAQELKFRNEGDHEVIDTGRLAHVLRLAGQAAGWGTDLPKDVGRGLAATVTDSYVAQVIEVEVTGGGLKVRRVVSVVDCGRVINPQLVSAQVESST
jgi:isoquinoline 1-oxidoreductase beta subunit